MKEGNLIENLGQTEPTKKSGDRRETCLSRSRKKKKKGKLCMQSGKFRTSTKSVNTSFLLR